jgi:hypothetical protein
MKDTRQEKREKGPELRKEPWIIFSSGSRPGRSL